MTTNKTITTTQPNVLLYTRNSISEQPNNYNDLYTQATILKRYCNANNYNILHHYYDEQSSVELRRKGWDSLYKFVKNNIGLVDTVLFTSWDSCSRDVEKTLLIIKEFKSMGVAVLTVNQSSEISNHEHSFILSVYLSQDEIRNSKLVKQNN